MVRAGFKETRDMSNESDEGNTGGRPKKEWRDI